MLAVNLCVMHFRHLFVLEMHGEDISNFVKGQMYALRRYTVVLWTNSKCVAY